ncbi:unnamed protein product [Dovyalis caffra]|uniref:Uncharacterized protein n=1 Tax=Dovyalis caffra TaxID=77055 RepID=A0AAV1SHX7_9ROSI|nr:unnamed protein product [Dovyalis caffra]
MGLDALGFEGWLGSGNIFAMVIAVMDDCYRNLEERQVCQIPTPFCLIALLMKEVIGYDPSYRDKAHPLMKAHPQKSMWSLIAGRIPGRTAEEIEKYWTSKSRSSNER